MSKSPTEGGLLVADADELLRRCQGGDEFALEQLIAVSSASVMRLAMQVLGDGGRAEEAAADTFAQVWRKCRQWRGESSASTWVYRIAYRMALDHRASRRRTTSKVPDLPDPLPRPEEVLANREARTKAASDVRQALERLSSDDRVLVHLHYFEGLALSEIAAIVGERRETLKMRLFRVRTELRTYLTWDEE